MSVLAVPALGNPLLDEYRRRSAHTCDSVWREPGGNPTNHGCGRTSECAFPDGVDRARLSWAVPDDGVLDLIAARSPQGVVEIGAGSGYWARLLSDRGVDVVAYDANPPRPDAPKDWNVWVAPMAPYHPVEQGGPEQAAEHPERTLLLCWPYMNSMAADAVKAYQGSTVVYVGEGPGGCTADDEFFLLMMGASARWCFECDSGSGDPHECTYHPPCSVLAETAPEWRERDSYQHPQWWGLHDTTHVYERVEVPS